MRRAAVVAFAAVVATGIAGSARAADGALALTTGSAALPTTSSAAEDVRMKALEAEVDSIKEKIFKSKARLLLLQETVLHGAAAGAAARIHFTNDIGKAYRLESANWVLDGQTIYEGHAGAPVPPGTKKPAAAVGATGETDDAALADRKDMTLFDGAIMPGTHNLSVTLVYRGYGYEVFKYLEGYRFTVQSTYPFTIEEGKTTLVEVRAVPKDGITHSYEDRLDMKFEASTRDSVPLTPATPEARP